MALPVALRLKSWGLALALISVVAPAAEQKFTAVGSTRTQVIERFGQPTRALAAGAREVLTYPTQRLVLRDGIVIEVESVVPESARRPAPRVEQPDPRATAGVAPAQDAAVTPAQNPAGAAPAAAPLPGTTSPDPRVAAGTVTPAVTTPPPPPVDPVVSIKSVRPAGAPRPKQEAAPVATAPVETPAAAQKSSPASSAGASAQKNSTTTTTASAPASTPAAPRVTATVPDRAAPRPAATTAEKSAETPPPVEEAPVPDLEQANKEKAEALKKAKIRASRRRAQDAEFDEPDAQVFTGWSYVIAILTIGIGGTYIWWRRRQHQIEMVATAVSRSPFAAPTVADTGARFTPDIVGRLEWKRFEELVAAYYAKTGVVARRTKAGPKGAVNIKISWKGESRPFAYVRVISNTTGLIEAAPLQDLVTVLATEDIRRGYVVSSGKFSVNARDLAEEKHLTLLPGDIFLEKLNALPDTARTELMQEIMAGDPVTPSCPKCEAKMMRAPDDPSLWRCANHPDQEIPARR